MPQYTNPLTGRVTRLPYGNGQGSQGSIVGPRSPGEWPMLSRMPAPAPPVRPDYSGVAEQVRRAEAGGSLPLPGMPGPGIPRNIKFPPPPAPVPPQARPIPTWPGPRPDLPRLPLPRPPGPGPDGPIIDGGPFPPGPGGPLREGEIQGASSFGAQTFGGQAAGTQQFPTDPGLPPGTQTTAPQPPTDRSSSLNNLAGQYGNIPGQGLTNALGSLPPSVTGQTFQGQQFVDQPDVYLPQLPGGGVGPPTSRSTGQPLGPPPNTTWNTEGRWEQQPGEEQPPVVPPDLPDIPDDFPQDPNDPGPYDPRTPGPTTQPQLSGINDLLSSIQTRDTAREARQAPYFNMLSQRLGELSQPVTGEGREADAIRLANQRAAERQQGSLAAQMAGAGLGDSGAMAGGQAGIEQWRGEANARQIAGLMQGQRQMKSQELQNLLGLAVQSGDMEAARNLQAQLQGEQLKLQQGQFADDLQYRYDVLGPSLGLQSQQLGQNWLLGLLGHMR